MSLITRCPTCETMFRVVPDQLRVSQGWVRCGQCAEVFDATQNMVAPPDASADNTSPPPTPTSTPTATPLTTPAPTSSARVVPGSHATPATPSPPMHARAADVTGNWAHMPEPPTGPASASWTQQQAGSSPHPGRTTSAPPEDALTDGQGARKQDWLDAPHTEPPPVIQPAEDDNTADIPMPADRHFLPTAPPNPAGDADVARDAGRGLPASFLQDEPAPSIWKRPVVRWALGVLLVLLLAVLAMQFLVKERDRVAAMHPGARPVLEALCLLADCRIGPLRQIESIVIDSSSFSRVRGDDYRLGFSLKNTAPIELAMPAIELSLTDPQDQPVIRRVILPTEFGARSAALASAATWTGSLALTVQPDIGAQRIAGYRLLAFYP